MLATGGTIATRTDEHGVSVARASASELVDGLPWQPGVQVRAEDVFTVGGYLMSFPRMHELAERAEHHLRDPHVAGVVVTHGTDTMEETAYFLDLVVEDDRPVVLTGAQRPADAADADGPRNLADALTVATHPDCRGLGTLIVFGGSIFAARGTRKSRTLAADSFAAPSGGPLGWVRGDQVQVELRPHDRPQLARPPVDELDFDDLRVDIAACYPGVDASAMYAFARQGARGIVLEATGAGNANPDICAAARELSDDGVVVMTSTRVESGPVAAIYGNGGGKDLLAAGAVPSGLLRAPQARVLLAVLLAVHEDPQVVRVELARHVGA